MDCTTIMVTHRLPVAQSADLVIVVADGAIAETGTPAALKRRKTSAYAALWAAGPEVESRVADAFLGAEHDDADLVPVDLPAQDDPMVLQMLEDLRSGALGASSHTLDDAPDAAPGASAATAAFAGKVIGETDEELEAFLVGAGGAEALARSILDALASAVDPGVVGNLSVAFEVTEADAVHRLVIVSDEDADSAVVEHGDREAMLALRIAGPDLLRLALGQLDPIEGVMNGRIQLSGDLEQVARLGQLFAAGPALAVG
jgi:putative sterol carrier protein